MMQQFVSALVVILLAVKPVSADQIAAVPGQMPLRTDLTASDILTQAHAAAGGAVWKRPSRLFMRGHAIFYRGSQATQYDRYEMSRVYPREKTSAHAADGKVRIEAWAGDDQVFVIAFDGTTTYDVNGPIDSDDANTRWRASFGFGAIRHALDPGWQQVRLPDDLVDGQPTYFVELTDPSGTITRFGIAHETYRIVYVGFDTDRGWHERRYSDFFSREGVSWVQPGRVRLFYNGVKQNEVIWTEFSLHQDFSDDHFVVESNQDAASGM